MLEVLQSILVGFSVLAVLALFFFASRLVFYELGLLPTDAHKRSARDPSRRTRPPGLDHGKRATSRDSGESVCQAAHSGTRQMKRWKRRQLGLPYRTDRLALFVALARER
jgi:hypothetical protein